MTKRLIALVGACCAVLSVSLDARLLAIAPGEDLTFKVQSQLVQIYVSVTEGSRRVVDLTPPDFILEEDGTPRQIERLDSVNMPLHVALLLDSSGSMGPTLAETQQAALTFVESLEPADRLSFIAFNSEVHLVPQLTDDRAPIIAAIRAAQAHGATRLYDALLFAMKHLAGVQGRKAVVLFSDGEDNGRTSSLDLVLNAAARHGFPIYTIAAREALRTDMLRRVLRQLSEINRGRMFVVDDPRELHAAFTEVARELRSIFVVNYYTNVPHDGRWHDVKVALANTKFKAHCRQGFFARSGANSMDAEANAPPQLPRSQPPPALQARAVQAATAELMSLPPRRVVDPKPLRLPPSAAPQPAEERGSPIFRVESRFVEVPVLVESRGSKESPPLNEKDFRIYEDDQLREVAFFSRDVTGGSLQEPRAKALSKLNAKPELRTRITAAAEAPELRLGRYYLVLDDMLTPAGAFLQVKRASEEILREFRDPLRPVSVHLLSEATADISVRSDPGPVIERIRKLAPHVNPMLSSNDGLVTVYEAFLIDRGDREAEQLAELRYAASVGAQFRNDLGQVDGQPGTPADQIRMMVANAVRQMLSENIGQLSRALDGLRAVINAASSDPGEYPKDVILLSSGFMLGRLSLRGDLSHRLQETIEEAKRARTRVHAVDASGLDNDNAPDGKTTAAFLVSNPHLASLLQRYAHGWRMNREEPLSQLATETGGQFLHSTNDLDGAVTKLIDTRGKLYYLGFISQQPADGRFHAVRVTVSDPAARVHARKGYFAQSSGTSDSTAQAGGEDPAVLLERARQAQTAGNMKDLAAALEPLARRFPSHMELWYNLGVAHFKLTNYQRAVEALQRAFALSPGERGVGVTLARALVAAGYRSAAVQTLQLLSRRQPDDVDLLMDLGRTYESDGLLDDAYQVYRHILDLSFAPPLDVYLLLARTSAQLGRSVEARIFVDDYLSLGGSDASVAQWKALLH